jgi:hypothetical protein
LDSTETFDSIGFRKIVIKPLVKVGNLKKKGVPFLILGVNKEINDKNVLNDSYAQGKLNFEIFKTPTSILGKYHLENIWKGNYNIESNTTLILKRKIGDTIKHISKIDFNVNYKKELPSYLFMNYFGNHFQWEPVFKEFRMHFFCKKKVSM